MHKLSSITLLTLHRHMQVIALLKMIFILSNHIFLIMNNYQRIICGAFIEYVIINKLQRDETALKNTLKNNVYSCKKNSSAPVKARCIYRSLHWIFAPEGWFYKGVLRQGVSPEHKENFLVRYRVEEVSFLTIRRHTVRILRDRTSFRALCFTIIHFVKIDHWPSILASLYHLHERIRIF